MSRACPAPSSGSAATSTATSSSPWKSMSIAKEPLVPGEVESGSDGVLGHVVVRVGRLVRRPARTVAAPPCGQGRPAMVVAGRCRYGPRRRSRSHDAADGPRPVDRRPEEHFAAHDRSGGCLVTDHLLRAVVDEAAAALDGREVPVQRTTQLEMRVALCLWPVGEQVAVVFEELESRATCCKSGF